MGEEEKSGYESLPIPSYEEATSSRPTSSQSFLGPEETSHDAERQGLLGRRDARPREGGGSRGYQPPTVESPRSSEESDIFLPSSGEASARSSAERLHREMEEMDMTDPMAGSSGSPSRFRAQFNKSLTSLTHRLSTFQLPFNIRLLSTGSFRLRLPESGSSAWILLGRVFAIAVVMSLIYILFISDTFSLRRGALTSKIYDPESVRIYVQSHVSEKMIRENLQRATGFDHIAGEEGDYFLASWMRDVFEVSHLEDVQMKEYQVYLNYPRENGRRVAIIDPPELAWEAKLEEEQVYNTPQFSQKQAPVFHGHSRAGNVSGPLIYANYGSREDFKRLKDMGVDLTGAIVLVRYYGTQGDRALKVKAAELAGAAGCLIYSDPKEDGFLRGEPWPNGPWRPADSVQRGAVSLMSWIVGDVLTPGWASTPDAKRISKDNNPGLVNIPSLPLAWRDAQPLLKALQGHGKPLTDSTWIGGVPDIGTWYTGDQSSPTVILANEQDEVEKQPIWNVFGSIPGIEQTEKTIVVGNHRDAWCFGAADPGSGSAVMLEVIRIFGDLVALDWRPLRSIVFASWDGEEYNLIGSTEWVEENIDNLRENALAYINVDTAVSGQGPFWASASPLFQRALYRVLDRTVDPINNQTLRALWDMSQSRLTGLGAGSDYVAFQDLAGTSSIDFGFRSPQGNAYPYHSCYDNFNWMEQYGDPGFQYHALMAQVWALLILELADEPILPFDFDSYASSVHEYIDSLSRDIDNAGGAAHNIDLGPLRVAADQFTKDAQEFSAYEQAWSDAVYSHNGIETVEQAEHRKSHNTRMGNFEKNLLDLEEGGGLKGREQFKHILFAPQKWSGYDEAYFPGVRDALEEQDWEEVQKQIQKAATILERASRKLVN